MQEWRIENKLNITFYTNSDSVLAFTGNEEYFGYDREKTMLVEPTPDTTSHEYHFDEVFIPKFILKEFIENRKYPNKPTVKIKDNILSKGTKSSLTQENNTLRRLFNQMVNLHYGEGVTAYQIDKDIPSSKKTIKKYLNLPKK